MSKGRNVNLLCELCEVYFSSPKEQEEHDWCLLHHTKLEQMERHRMHTCSLCCAQCEGLSGFITHCKEKQHTDREAARLKDITDKKKRMEEEEMRKKMELELSKAHDLQRLQLQRKSSPVPHGNSAYGGRNNWTTDHGTGDLQWHQTGGKSVMWRGPEMNQSWNHWGNNQSWSYNPHQRHGDTYNNRNRSAWGPKSRGRHHRRTYGDGLLKTPPNAQRLHGNHLYRNSMWNNSDLTSTDAYSSQGDHTTPPYGQGSHSAPQTGHVNPPNNLGRNMDSEKQPTSRASKEEQSSSTMVSILLKSLKQSQKDVENTIVSASSALEKGSKTISSIGSKNKKHPSTDVSRKTFHPSIIETEKKSSNNTDSDLSKDLPGQCEVNTEQKDSSTDRYQGDEQNGRSLADNADGSDPPLSLRTLLASTSAPDNSLPGTDSLSASTSGNKGSPRLPSPNPKSVAPSPKESTSDKNGTPRLPSPNPKSASPVPKVPNPKPMVPLPKRSSGGAGNNKGAEFFEEFENLLERHDLRSLLEERLTGRREELMDRLIARYCAPTRQYNLEAPGSAVADITALVQDEYIIEEPDANAIADLRSFNIDLGNTVCDPQGVNLEPSGEPMPLNPTSANPTSANPTSANPTSANPISANRNGSESSRECEENRQISRTEEVSTGPQATTSNLQRENPDSHMEYANSPQGVGVEVHKGADSSPLLNEDSNGPSNKAVSEQTAVKTEESEDSTRTEVVSPRLPVVRSVPHGVSSSVTPNMPSPMGHNMASPMAPNMASPMAPNMASPVPPNVPSPMTPNMVSPMGPNMASPMAPNMASSVPSSVPSPMAFNVPSPMAFNVPSPMAPNVPSPMAPNMAVPMASNMVAPVPPSESLSASVAPVSEPVEPVVSAVINSRRPSSSPGPNSQQPKSCIAELLTGNSGQPGVDTLRSLLTIPTAPSPNSGSNSGTSVSHKRVKMASHNMPRKRIKAASNNMRSFSTSGSLTSTPIDAARGEMTGPTHEKHASTMNASDASTLARLLADCESPQPSNAGKDNAYSNTDPFTSLFPHSPRPLVPMVIKQEPVDDYTRTPMSVGDEPSRLGTDSHPAQQPLTAVPSGCSASGGFSMAMSEHPATGSSTDIGPSTMTGSSTATDLSDAFSGSPSLRRLLTTSAVVTDNLVRGGLQGMSMNPSTPQPTKRTRRDGRTSRGGRGLASHKGPYASTSSRNARMPVTRPSSGGTNRFAFGHGIDSSDVGPGPEIAAAMMNLGVDMRRLLNVPQEPNSDVGSRANPPVHSVASSVSSGAAGNHSSALDFGDPATSPSSGHSNLGFYVPASVGHTPASTAPSNQSFDRSLGPVHDGPQYVQSQMAEGQQRVDQGPVNQQQWDPEGFAEGGPQPGMQWSPEGEAAYPLSIDVSGNQGVGRPANGQWHSEDNVSPTAGNLDARRRPANRQRSEDSASPAIDTSGFAAILHALHQDFQREQAVMNEISEVQRELQSLQNHLSNLESQRNQIAAGQFRLLGVLRSFSPRTAASHTPPAPPLGSASGSTSSSAAIGPEDSAERAESGYPPGRMRRFRPSE